jgi:hypothetical protein
MFKEIMFFMGIIMNVVNGFISSLRATVMPKADPPLTEKERGNLKGLLRRFAPRNDILCLY